MRILLSAEQSLIVGALRAAAELYQSTSKSIEDGEGSPQLIAQFDKQADDAIALADEIEGADALAMN